jgi:hypothetical protein
MAWFARMKRRFRNYTSAGDYAGAQGGGSSGKGTSHSTARADAAVTRINDASPGPTS